MVETRPHVVVVDDNAALAEVMRDTLELAGYSVALAENGRTALAMLRERPADLVITDIFMPDIDGIETILELRRQWPDVPIVAMSGGGTLGNLTYLPAARQLGAVRTISKPFECADLVALARELLGR